MVQIPLAKSLVIGLLALASLGVMRGLAQPAPPPPVRPMVSAQSTAHPASAGRYDASSMVPYAAPSSPAAPSEPAPPPYPVPTESVAQRVVMRAFAPLMDLVNAAAYPITYTMMAMGALLFAVGSKQRGVTTMKMAAIGYVILQFVPALMQVLVSVGQAMRYGAG